MFGFLRRKKNTPDNKADAIDESVVEPVVTESIADSAEADNAAYHTADTEQDNADNLQLHNTPAETTPEPAIKTTAEPPTEAPDTEAKNTEAPDTISSDTDSAINTTTDSTGETKKGMLGRLRDRLSKTRHNLTDGMADLVLGKKSIDDDLLEELETRLLSADVGIEATTRIISDLTKRVSRKELNNPEALFQALCDDMVEILKQVDQPLLIEKSTTPFVILVVGINGAGKTTTIGKLAKRFQNQGKSVMLAAGDTFRAAAVEQLQTWGERNNITVVAQGTGADSASVIYDAVESAKAKNIDVVIADTAGRLHTQVNLMDELIKIKRVMGKLDNSAPHETLLVMDAGFGQNGLVQAQQFNQAMGLTGLVLTKLDGTAKGGILFAIAEKLGIPIRFIGVGESIDDLREFHAAEFVDALLDRYET